jgi:hypothetical protein
MRGMGLCRYDRREVDSKTIGCVFKEERKSTDSKNRRKRKDRSDNNFAIQEFPAEDAISSGVRPSLSLASMFAPCRSSRRTIVPSKARRDDAARCSGVDWSHSVH